MTDYLSLQVESLLRKMFAAADRRGSSGSAAFAECFAEDGQFLAGGKVLNGQKGTIFGSIRVIRQA
jgi:hypothetical protein